MIRSMTGYGDSAFELEGIPFEVEVRAGNHRYLDLRVRLPHAVAHSEGQIRGLIQQRLRRGKVDLSVRMAGDASAPSASLEFDFAAAERYLGAARELQERHALPGALDVATLLRLPGVVRLVQRSLPADALSEALHAAVEAALASVETMREAEGAALRRELEARLDRLSEGIGSIEQNTGLVRQAARERLRKRAEQLRDETGLLDEARLHQEIVLAADRLDVTEEIARLRSHVQQFRGILSEADPEHPAGRRLGFLLQEMGREVNTIGSKSADAPIALQVVELKTELERLREQVQNVE